MIKDTLWKRTPYVMSRNVYPTLTATAATGLLQLGFRCLTLSVYSSCALGGAIYVASRFLNNFVRTKYFGVDWDTLYNQTWNDFYNERLDAKIIDLTCTVLTGAVGTLVFKMITAGATTAILPTLATGALAGVVIYTATKIAAFLIRKALNDMTIFSILEDTKNFFRWITWQSYTEADLLKAQENIKTPLKEFKTNTNLVVEEVKNRAYPENTQPLKKKEALEMVGEQNKFGEVKNPWKSDNPHDELHKQNYLNAKETVKETLGKLITKIKDLETEIENKVKTLHKENKIDKIRLDIFEAQRTSIDKLRSARIELQIELECWNEV